MTTLKINLSALKKDKEEIIPSLNQDLGTKKEEENETIKLSEAKDEIVEIKKPKVKISLKWLNENIIEEKKETIIKEELITSEDNQEVIIKVTQEQELDEKLKEKVEEKNTFSIIDWDTQVSVINEEKNEIFWSYKGSFNHTKDEIKWEKIKLIEEKQEIKEEKIKLWSENISNLQKEIQNVSWETNLERYAKLNSNKKSIKKILIPVLSLIFVLWVSISSWIFLNNKNLKTNLNEVKSIKNKSQVEKIQETNLVDDLGSKNTEVETWIVEENNTQVEENSKWNANEIEDPKTQIDNMNEGNLEENQSPNDLNLDSLLNDVMDSSVNENESTDFVNENNLDTLDKNVIMKEKLRKHLLQKLKNN